jgi:hypothetical protein
MVERECGACLPEIRDEIERAGERFYTSIGDDLFKKNADAFIVDVIAFRLREARLIRPHRPTPDQRAALALFDDEKTDPADDAELYGILDSIRWVARAKRPLPVVEYVTL